MSSHLKWFVNKCLMSKICFHIVLHCKKGEKHGIWKRIGNLFDFTAKVPLELYAVLYVSAVSI